jgi:hypothetical protein
LWFLLDHALDADGLIVVVERSEVMAASGELDLARKEIHRALQALRALPGRPIAIVFFDRGVLSFPASGEIVESTCGAILSAAAFVDSIAAGEGACLREAVEAALLLADRLPAARKAIAIVSRATGATVLEVGDVPAAGELLEFLGAPDPGC